MKSIVTASLVIALAGASPLVQAQFGSLLGNLKGGASAAGSGSANLGAQQDVLARSYVAAGKDVLTANGHLAEALGIKAQAVNASATADSLSAKDIEAQDKAISAESAAVSEALKSGVALKDADAKAKYAQGLLFLVSGVKKYMDMGKDVQSFTAGMSSVSPMQLPSLQSGLYIAKSLPTSVSNLSSVLKSAIDFAKTNGVEVPKDATSLL